MLRSGIFVDAFEADLVRGRVADGRNAEEITLFKSVGSAVQDLVTAPGVAAGRLGPALGK